MCRSISGALACALILSGCFSTATSTQKVTVTETRALKAFDYGDWQNILRSHVDGNGRVDYAALKADRVQLDRFVALLAAVGPNTRPDLFTTSEQKLAYYINAYNAFTMFNVINRLPSMTSVNDDIKSFFYFTEFLMDGDQISLYNLENKVIRKEFTEPRIHFALNCASVGCPQLPAEAFLPDTLESQLARETTRFLKETRNVTVENGTIVLSQIFEWYAVDFPPSPAEWVKTQDESITFPEGAPVKYRPYDWSLNRQ